MYKADEIIVTFDLILDCVIVLYRVTRVTHAGVLTIGSNTATLHY